MKAGIRGQGLGLSGAVFTNPWPLTPSPFSIMFAKEDGKKNSPRSPYEQRHSHQL